MYDANKEELKDGKKQINMVEPNHKCLCGNFKPDVDLTYCLNCGKKIK